MASRQLSVHQLKNTGVMTQKERKKKKQVRVVT